MEKSTALSRNLSSRSLYNFAVLLLDSITIKNPKIGNGLSIMDADDMEIIKKNLLNYSYNF